ncbi:MAG: hypothetical protein E7292_00205 [Lachnospiraceae bacterium]|nr:hypothetical protein [Lachnospiraceae bacterium]
MKGKQLRIYVIEDKEMVFNVSLFRDLFRNYAQKKGMRLGEYEYEVAEYLYVDSSTIHSWRMRVSGPGDIEKIKLLAKLWNIKYELLLKEAKRMSTAMQHKELSDREKTALKNVYVSFLNYMGIFKKTAGFIWNEDGTLFNISMAYTLYAQVINALEIEFIDLKGNAYDELKTFYDTELTYTLETYYCEEDGDCPELQQAETEGLYQLLLNQFKQIIVPFLVVES